MPKIKAPRELHVLRGRANYGTGSVEIHLDDLNVFTESGKPAQAFVMSADEADAMADQLRAAADESRRPATKRRKQQRSH